MIHLIAALICVVGMLFSYKNTNLILINGILAILNTLLYIGDK